MTPMKLSVAMKVAVRETYRVSRSAIFPRYSWIEPVNEQFLRILSKK
jgi:hypothetical protein